MSSPVDTPGPPFDLGANVLVLPDHFRLRKFWAKGGTESDGLYMGGFELG